MASVKLVKQIAAVIDPKTAEYEKIKLFDRTDEQSRDLSDLYADCEEIIELVEDHQATTRRLLVVGQIRYDGSETLHTVALGPYGARGVLSDDEKFRKAAEASTAAHEAGGRLAWDTRTGKGKGRYMVVPIFRTPRDAWDFYRASSDVSEDELTEQIEVAIEREPYEIVPACICGHRSKSKCYRHNKEQ